MLATELSEKRRSSADLRALVRMRSPTFRRGSGLSLGFLGEGRNERDPGIDGSDEARI